MQDAGNNGPGANLIRLASEEPCLSLNPASATGGHVHQQIEELVETLAHALRRLDQLGAVLPAAHLDRALCALADQFGVHLVASDTE